MKDVCKKSAREPLRPVRDCGRKGNTKQLGAMYGRVSMPKCDRGIDLTPGIYSADACERGCCIQHCVGLLTLPVVENDDCDHDCDNDQEEDEKAKAYPPLLASRTSGSNRFVGVTHTRFRILFDVGCSLLDNVYRFVLLFDQDTHLHVSVRRFTITRETDLAHPHTSLNSCASSARVRSIFWMSLCLSWTSR